MLTFISLFAGIGGFELGFERAGMVCGQQVEIDDNCNQVLTHHWPEVKRLLDVRDARRHNLETADLICGGFPCQDVSVAGRREGLDGERSGLWFEFVRIVEELRPKWVVIENVPGLLSSNEKRDFAAVLSGLGQRGYWWAYRVFDAQYYGVPQRRRRVFVVGCLARGRAQEVLFERESSPWDTPPGREAGKGFAAEVTSSLRTGGVGGYPSPRSAEDWITVAYQCHGSNVGPMGTLRKGDGGITSGVPFVCNAFNGYTGGADDNDAQGGHIIPFDTTQITSDQNRNNPQPGDPCHPLAAKSHAPAIISRDSVPKTAGGKVTDLRAGNPHPSAVLSDMGVRRLTPAECERLQGFPDGWTAVNGMSDSARYRMLGNAVCVPVAEWLGRRIVMVEGI